MKSQEELDEMSMIELVEEFIATCDRVIERNNSGNAVQLHYFWVTCLNVSCLGATMTRKPPKHIVKLGKEAVMLWKLQQVLGKQIGTDKKRFLDWGTLRRG